MRQGFSWLQPSAVALLAIVGCDDLRLVDHFDEASSSATGGGTTSTNVGGAPQVSGQGGITQVGGHPAQIAGAGSASTTPGGGSAGGSPMGAGGLSSAIGGTVTTVGGTTATGGTVTTVGGTTATGGVTIGGTAPATGGATSTIGGKATGGAVTSSAGSQASGGVATGGTATGGTAMGGAATGGTAGSAGTATGGTAGSAGTATGGTAGSAGSPSAAGQPNGGAAGKTSVCPLPISKPIELLAAEPTPVDKCARVSNVITFAANGYYAFGFTNGEAYIFTPASSSQTRADNWNTSGTQMYTARAIVTSMVAPQNNYEWALQMGHADPQGGVTKPWRTGMLGRGWSEATVEEPGPVIALAACPFHNGSLTHIDMTVPFTSQRGSLSVGASFAKADAGTLNVHMKLGSRVTAVERVMRSDGWLVYAGTEGGEIYVSNLLTGNIDTTSNPSATITWNRITGAGMPGSWVTRIAVHPNHQERIFVVFANFSNTADSVWYSQDSGTTWANRHGNLPIAVNQTNLATPVFGVSFNPTYEGAAYAVTSLTSYYTLDYGGTWTEW